MREDGKARGRHAVPRRQHLHAARSEREALADIKARLYALRQTGPARDEADAIQARHGSRKAGLPPSAGRPARTRRKPGATPDDAQGELF